jgi:LmbE family N-acetylglucosaminyl deacetylase
MIPERPRKVLAIFAHPDDAEILCFGSLLHFQEAGAEVVVSIATSGRRGISLEDRESTGINDLGDAIRIEESRRAFAATGVALDPLGLPDGELRPERNLILAMESCLRRHEPDLLLTHFACEEGLDHQDHRAVSIAAMNAARRCRSIRMILQPEPLWSDPSFRPTHFIDITSHFERKLEALRAHKTQTGRFYLDEPFQRMRAQQSALRAGSWHFEKQRLFESAECALAVRS